MLSHHRICCMDFFPFVQKNIQGPRSLEIPALVCLGSCTFFWNLLYIESIAYFFLPLPALRYVGNLSSCRLFFQQVECSEKCESWLLPCPSHFPGLSISPSAV